MDTDVAIYRPMREKPNKKCRQYFACCASQVTHAKKLAQDINNLNCHIGHMSTTYLCQYQVFSFGRCSKSAQGSKDVCPGIDFSCMDTQNTRPCCHIWFTYTLYLAAQRVLSQTVIVDSNLVLLVFGVANTLHKLVPGPLQACIKAFKPLVVT